MYKLGGQSEQAARLYTSSPDPSFWQLFLPIKHPSLSPAFTQVLHIFAQPFGSKFNLFELFLYPVSTTPITNTN
jgi:hypothetical protein